MNRRGFLAGTTLGLGAVLVAPSVLAQQTPPTAGGDKPPKPPPYDPTLVKNFVAAGHNNLDKVKEMLGENPNLLYAMWDWGGGDFETALEGAGHVGDQDIANFLIGQGARANIFVLTMLGKTSIVMPVLEAYPALLNAKGPHGYTLLHHAERGGDAAAELFAYLESRGLKDKRLSIY